MTIDHYLAGPCEGMSLHTDGKLLTIRDATGREPARTWICDDEKHALESLWRWRDILYARYIHTNRAGLASQPINFKSPGRTQTDLHAHSKG